MRFKSVSLSEICDFPRISAGVTKEFIRNNPGNIPVYGSSKDGDPIGFIADIKGVRYFDKCLGWNRNGSVGYVFYHDHKFTTTDDHRPLCIKEGFLEKLDIGFMRFIIQDAIFGNGFGWGDKAGVEKLKLLYIDIPVTESGDFDIVAQQTMAQKYKKIHSLQRKMIESLDNIKKTKFILEKNEKTRFKQVDILTLFESVKGNSKYTQKYFSEHVGDYPVYSSQTKNNGVIAKIDTYDFDAADDKWLTWTTDGVYAGSTFVRTGKFSMTTHCGLLKPKSNISKNISIDYVKCLLNNILPNCAVGDQNRRVTVAIMSNVSVPIPLAENGDFDLGYQQVIANKYNDLENKKNKIIDMLQQIGCVQVKFA